MKVGGRIFLIILAVIILLAVPQAAYCKTELKFGHVLQEDHPYHKMALKFKEELEKRNDNLVVNIFPARQLGSERDLLEGVQIGSVDISTITSDDRIFSQ